MFKTVGSNSDGWVPNEHWEDAQLICRDAFEQWMEAMRDENDPNMTEEKARRLWPFEVVVPWPFLPEVVSPLESVQNMTMWMISNLQWWNVLRFCHEFVHSTHSLAQKITITFVMLWTVSWYLAPKGTIRFQFELFQEFISCLPGQQQFSTATMKCWAQVWKLSSHTIAQHRWYCAKYTVVSLLE